MTSPSNVRSVDDKDVSFHLCLGMIHLTLLPMRAMVSSWLGSGSSHCQYVFFLDCMVDATVDFEFDFDFAFELYLFS
jgi:hypothetical protein